MRSNREAATESRVCDAPTTNIEWHAALDASHVLLLGEMHGTNEIPKFAAAVACDALRKGRSVGLFVESPWRENTAYRPLGFQLIDLGERLKSLDVRYANGSGWNCQPECRAHPLAGQDLGPDPRSSGPAHAGPSTAGTTSVCHSFGPSEGFSRSVASIGCQTDGGPADDHATPSGNSRTRAMA